ncbi:MAG: hypothetical protein ACKOZM_10045 [Flavobacteriales bacterium]
MKRPLNHVGFGILGGLIGALLGFCIFGLGFSWYNGIFFSEFVNDIFLGDALQDFQSRILSFSMLADVLLFFLLVKRGYEEFCKGLIIVLVISVAVIAWLY